MDWKAYYKDHIVTAEEAVTHIQSKDRVINSHLGGAPCLLYTSPSGDKTAAP